MRNNGCISIALCICLFCWSLILVSPVSSAVIGETVHLSGMGDGYDEMYLFLTGPNLAPGGVRLDSITTPVVSGNAASFTRASVRSGVWDYEWDTGRTGGTLDPGTYLVWALPQPLDRYDRGRTSYATKSVRLTYPVLTADISATTASDGAEKVDEMTAEAHAAVPGGISVGDGAFPDVRDGSEEAQTVSEDTMPLPTTAGSFLYPELRAGGIGVFFLICVWRKKNRRYK
ncbi:hypothetical protein L1S32_00670 [Methanogenium sp. S4BF]|uniref:hypothetical protein n=1 Tax=Methanogenium sp. S4BF TaxID=1789226 RepID=UPI002415F417|nr:hypothetical protein [Methanogenium sp. S4BF]WFN34669.1 hypothetical protein L1S32_00670 [Methanogenium sp. S4BF]